MLRVGFEPTISAGERPKAYALGRVLRASDQRARAFPAHSLDRTNKCK